MATAARNKSGRFVKKTKRKAPAKKSTSRAIAKTTRTTRRRPSTAMASTKLKVLIPQAAAGVGGYMVTDWATVEIVKRLPADITSRIPAWAAPAVKGGVVLTAGWAVRKHGPRDAKKYVYPFLLGGLISAGLDVVDMIRARGLSGYWSNGMAGYSEEEVEPSRLGARYNTTDMELDPETGEYVSGRPAVIVDLDSL